MKSKSNNETRDAILQTLASIPEGRVCTYGTIARLAGSPGQARYVGYILKTLPHPTSIPWHRVINSKGKSAFPPGSDKYSMQMTRLKQEGIVVVDSASGETIEMSTCFWPDS